MMLEKIGFFIHQCARTKAVGTGIPLHAVVVKSGIQADILIGNHILNLYAKCGRIDSARKVFDEMPQRNLVSWSAMISGYDQSNRPQQAIQIFREMQDCYKPNEFASASALSSCANAKDLKQGLQIHAQVLKLGHGSVSFVFNSLVLMYMKCGICTDALSIFSDSMSDFVNLVSYNIAITGLVENSHQEKGIEMFKKLCLCGLVPDKFTFAGLFRNGEPVFDLSVVMQLHGQIVKLGLDSMAFSANVLPMVYSNFNLNEESERVFRSIVDKDAISWNTAIAACCQSDDKLKAIDVFREMMDNNVCPDDYTYATVLSAAASVPLMCRGKEIHGHLIRARSSWDIAVGNALVNMYAKSGSIASSYAVFKLMKIQNLVSWNTIITAVAHHGLAEKALALFEEMLSARMEPDSITFVALLTACNHSGLACEGIALFNSMVTIYGITPDAQHLCCLVDLLGRSGRVTEALEYTQRYPIGNDAVVLGSLLSACRLNGGVTPGQQIAKRLLDLRPATTSPYVLLSNLYASDSNWDSVEGARKLLQASGLKKEAGYSLIEVKGSVEKFTIGDFSHVKMEDIVNLLEALARTRDEEHFGY